MKRKKKQGIVLGTLVAVILGMCVGYAALNQLLTIQGTSGITGDFSIQFTKIVEHTLVDATTVKTDGIGTTTASFTVDLGKPGSSATYDITVANKGSMDAVLTDIIGIEESNLSEPLDIKYFITGLDEGDDLNAGVSKTFQVRVVWDSTATSVPTQQKSLVLKLNYEQKTGNESGGNKEYIVGDEIYFDPTIGTTCNMGEEWTEANIGSTCYKWNVIKNSDISNNVVEVLLDHNIGEPIAWTSKEDYIAAGGTEVEYGFIGNDKYGPITAVNTLNNLTTFWQGVESYTSTDNVTRENGSGGTYTINYDGMNAKLISGQEVADIKGEINWTPGNMFGSLPTWLYTNLAPYSNTTNILHGGYWTDTSYTSDFVYLVNYDGAFNVGDVAGAGNRGPKGVGVRPVVKILRTNL